MAPEEIGPIFVTKGEYCLIAHITVRRSGEESCGALLAQGRGTVSVGPSLLLGESALLAVNAVGLGTMALKQIKPLCVLSAV